MTSGPLWFFANLVEVKLKLSQQESGGGMSIVASAGAPGDMAPLHLHHRDDEVWYVLDGRMTFFVENEEPLVVDAGGLAFGPKGIPHTYRVESGEGARWLVICTPGDFERFVVATSRPAERNELPPPAQPSEEQAAEIARLAEEHGIELLGPPGALPAGHSSE